MMPYAYIQVMEIRMIIPHKLTASPFPYMGEGLP